jgi:hypothetical protein
VPWLSKRLLPAVEVAARIRRLIADLDSEHFQTRKAALDELRELGGVAEPALRRVLEGKPSAELRRSVQSLLPVPWVVASSEERRRLRAVAVLEQTGTPAARPVLDRLAAGAEGARQTREAQAALRRLTRPRTHRDPG